MEYEEDMEWKEIKEKVMVPAQRRESNKEEEEETLEELVEPKVWTIPRRWHIH